MRFPRGPVLVASISACSHASPPTLPVALPAPSHQATWSYQVIAAAQGAELRVRATFPPGSVSELSVDDDAEPFVRDLAVRDGERWRDVPASADGLRWTVPSCSTQGCELRYRYALAEAASSIHNIDTAISAGHAYLAPPSTWLLRPLSAPNDARFRFQVTTPAGTSFVSGIAAQDAQSQTYEGRIDDLPMSPYSAFGDLRRHTVTLSGGEVLQIALGGAELEVGDAALVKWVAHKASIVASYFGRFPVTSVLVLVLATPGARFEFGKTLGNGGASILLPMGVATSAESLAGDWVLVHEMMHVGFPNVGRTHSWLEEGMATYLEPIARVREGDLDEQELWRGLADGLPKGLPAAGDLGLERTPTWGRTYWGGALFWFLSDVAIRERTHNRHNIDDAIRAIARAGGTVAARWDVPRVIAVGDGATGTSVLADLYRQMSLQPFVVDLDDLWKRLGVRMTPTRVIFDDAPLSYVRRAITAR